MVGTHSVASEPVTGHLLALGGSEYSCRQASNYKSNYGTALHTHLIQQGASAKCYQKSVRSHKKESRFFYLVVGGF